MSAIDRAVTRLPRRVAAWASDHPFRVAGGVATLLAVTVMLVSLDVVPAQGRDVLAATTPAALAAYAGAHPAYPVAAVVGLSVLLFWR